MRTALAFICYGFCFLMLWSVYGTPEWQALSTGFPVTDREYVTAGIVAAAMAAKLLGHLYLFSTSRAR
jgi:hypothetical protein